jgi:AcrR family transcriptional regulator
MVRRSRAEQVERNRETLLAAALSVFSEHGYAGATLEAIADEAGFSKGVVYSQFESKADLFLTLLERRIDERADENERVAGDLAGAEGVAELIRHSDRDSRAEASWARLLVEFRVHAGRDPEVNRRYGLAHARTLQRLSLLLDGLHERAGVTPTVSAHVMAEFVLAVGSGVILERLVNPGALDVEVADMLVGALGLGTSAASAASGARLGDEIR